MKIFLHRGYWVDGNKQNSLDAFKKAFDLGYSVELDVKFSDIARTIVVGHDIQDYECTLSEVIALHQSYNDSMLALNIKQDGLASLIKSYQIKSNNFFCFDMSNPEYFKYKDLDIPLAVRLSDYESPIFENNLYWLDSIDSEWWAKKKDSLPKGNLILVAPELHGRTLKNLYEISTEMNFFGICLDNPNCISS